MESGIFQITEKALSLIFTEEYWKLTHRQQCVLLVLYASYKSGSKQQAWTRVVEIINQRKLLEKINEEFVKLCFELKDNKEFCEDFINLSFN